MEHYEVLRGPRVVVRFFFFVSEAREAMIFENIGFLARNVGFWSAGTSKTLVF